MSNDEIEVKRVKNPHAVAMAKLRKGIKEPFSQLKHDSALKNLKKALKARKEIARVKGEQRKAKKGSICLDELRERLRK